MTGITAASPDGRTHAAAGRRRLRPGRATRRLLRNRAAMCSLAFLVLLVMTAVFASLIATHDPAAQSLAQRLQGPSTGHWLGTDRLGRDNFSRLAFASRAALQAAFLAVGIAVALGTSVGLAASLGGRFLDAVASRAADALMALPPLVLALALIAVLGPGLTNAMIAIGLILAPRFYRVARAASKSVATELYIEGARASGCSTFRLLWRHILPNVSSPLLVQISFSTGVAIVAEATLSFLGLGARPPTSSWGSMLAAAFDDLSTNSFGVYPPTIVIALTVLSFSVLGDGLRDAIGREARG